MEQSFCNLKRNIFMLNFDLKNQILVNSALDINNYNYNINAKMFFRAIYIDATITN